MAVRKRRRKRRKIRKALLHAFFPMRCASCGELINYDRVLCKECERSLESHNMPTCHKCGASLDDHDEEVCSGISCPVVTAFYYKDRVKRLIIDFKDYMRNDIFETFYPAVTERVAVEYADIEFDMTASVPSYERKRHSTSVTMAKELAHAFMLDYDKNLLIKYRETEKQHMLGQSGRMENLKNSITFNDKKKHLIEGKTILLCDDVKSTGATLDECAKALYQAGAKQVCCICIAVSDYTVRLSEEKAFSEKIAEKSSMIKEQIS